MFSSGMYQLLYCHLRQLFDRDSPGRDNGAPSCELGKTYH